MSPDGSLREGTIRETSESLQFSFTPQRHPRNDFYYLEVQYALQRDPIGAPQFKVIHPPVPYNLDDLRVSEELPERFEIPPRESRAEDIKDVNMLRQGSPYAYERQGPSRSSQTISFAVDDEKRRTSEVVQSLFKSRGRIAQCIIQRCASHLKLMRREEVALLPLDCASLGADRNHTGNLNWKRRDNPRGLIRHLGAPFRVPQSKYLVLVATLWHARIR